MKNMIKGLGVALVTPFDEKGAVDFDALGRIVDNVIFGGVDFLVTLGTTAETPTLSGEERAAVSSFVRDRAAGRVPVVIGMGGNNTAHLCEELREFSHRGFAAVLSVTPYYNKPSQEGLFRHFQAVAEASPLPVILYNVPSRTGVNLAAETTLRLAREVPNIIGIKDACGEISQIKEVAEGAPEGFVVLSGDDAMALPAMSVGGHGLISVAANAFPEQMSRMIRTASESSIARAQALWADMEDVCRLLFAEGSPAGIKTALAVRGVCRPDVRLPLVRGSERLRGAIEQAVSTFVISV